MAIAGSQILAGPDVAFTNGSGVNLNTLGEDRRSHDVYVEGPEFLDRTVISFTSKLPKVSLNSPSGYTQARSEVLIKRPITLASGATTIITGFASVGLDVESASDDKLRLREYLGQLLLESVYTDFWDQQSVA